MWWRDGLRLAPAVLTSRVRATPYKLLLSLTDHCNLRCGHCHAWRRRTAELTPDELGRTLASLPGLRWLDITGGEPTLRPDLDACVAAITPALQRAVFVHFPTNGWQVDAAAALAIGLRDASPARVVVTVSVDGPEEIHDRLRGREGSYARALETWRRLDGLPGVEVYVGTTVTPENAAALPEAPDAVIVDPPRAGLSAAAVDVVAGLNSGVLAYMSCHGPSLARDAERLAAAGWLPSSLRPADMLPQTPHVEWLATFRRS